MRHRGPSHYSPMLTTPPDAAGAGPVREVLRAARGGARPVAVLVTALGARAVVAVLSALYALLKLLPVRNKVVLMSRLYAETSQDFALLAAEIPRQDHAARVVVLNHRNLNPARVPGQVLVEMYHLATARGCIIDSYMVPVSVLRHRRRLVVVQMWHALGALKRFGLTTLDTAEGRPGALAVAMRMHQGYDWVITGGQRMVEPFAASFGVAPEQVLPIGTPRVDLLLDPANVAAKRAAIRAAHPALGARPVVLYAPTFRKGGEPVRVTPLLDALGCGREFDVVVALHPLDRRRFPSHHVIQDDAFSTLDWLTVADHVVTDYSAIAFDAAVLGVPLYFYVYDLEGYRARRGLLFDYAGDVPGPVCLDAVEVVAAIRSGAGSRERVERFRADYVVGVDGGCTRRIAELALGATPGQLT